MVNGLPPQGDYERVRLGVVLAFKLRRIKFADRSHEV